MSDPIQYTGRMLPDVDYNQYDDDWGASLVTLEYGVLENYKACLDALKTLFIEQEIVSFPESMMIHFAGYIGMARSIYYPYADNAALECLINVISEHSHNALKLFQQYPIYGKTLSKEEQSSNAGRLRDAGPGSIVVQTIRLGRRVFDAMEDIKIEQPFRLPIRGEEKPLLVEQNSFMNTMIPLLMQQRPNWDSDNIKDRDVLNQLCIQFAWLVAYFAHASHETIENSYLEMLFKQLLTYNTLTKAYLQTYGVADSSNPPSDEVQEKLDAISTLSQKTHAEYAKPIANDTERNIKIANATLEKCCIELLTQGRAVKILLIIVFQYWFMLDGPQNGFSKNDFEHFSAVSTMNDFIALIKKVSDTLPDPELSENIHELNARMDALKEHLPPPNEFEKVSEEDKLPHTLAVDAAIRDCLEKLASQKIPTDVLAMALFSQWLRLSVFFGVPEKDWQKLDFYFAEILTAAREYLKEMATEQSIVTQIKTKLGRNSPCSCGSGKKYKKCCLH